ncbi:SDR family oxidoreductase [Litchfieldia salsa]|uniref:NAD(P)-dependent dehydrogenase, short-chain alcohol dehydrogenase family n=1 Tax=Litchfieldia salsa TaxID=930152 RepID=A0A1H0VQK4_9BACI|nr:SDR family oxidoreductase [Litchfieldia salsa]SDP80879.1 NAD(P)-dependent dehydrogenase, short-chain alcohol dehydrogenase family [Litchfieldia salsa]
MDMNHKEIQFPPQHQPFQPGFEWMMKPQPISEDPEYKGSGKLQDKVAIITGGDSGIGKATAIAFAKEGASVVIVYLNEEKDATDTKNRIESLGGKCLAISADMRHPDSSEVVVQKTLDAFGKINILVNNCAVQYVQESILDISNEQMVHTFQTNIFSYFYLTKAALPQLEKGDTIINTASIVAYQGHKQLLDYSATKGAVVTFTRSLSLQLAEKGIRVNGIAPGPIWTPLIPSSFSAEDVMTFGADTELNRAGQPYELAPAYVYLASEDSSYVTGQIIHINGGDYRSS